MTSAAGLGTIALPDRDRVDFARLRQERRAKVFAAMATHQLDALLLGRPANIAYVSGARQLWTAGARPFGPGAVVVRETGHVHLLSTWDDGVPEEISHEDLFGLTWNPANLVARLAAIPGLSGAARIGTDSMSPGFPQLLAAIARDASIVDATAALAATRTVKSGDEVRCIETATALAEAGLEALIEALRPGVTERALVGLLAARLAGLGVTAPAREGVVCATEGRGPVRLRQIPDSRPIASGALVVLDPSTLYAGYEGGVGRTWVAGDDRPTPASQTLASRCRAALDGVLDACRAGGTGADLRRAWEAAGEQMPPVPLAHGVGLGVEPPIIASGVGDRWDLVAGMVLSVQGWVAQEGVGGVLQRELVLVGDGAPRLLSRFGSGPLLD